MSSYDPRQNTYDARRSQYWNNALQTRYALNSASGLDRRSGYVRTTYDILQLKNRQGQRKGSLNLDLLDELLDQSQQFALSDRATDLNKLRRSIKISLDYYKWKLSERTMVLMQSADFIHRGAQPLIASDEWIDGLQTVMRKLSRQIELHEIAYLHRVFLID